MVIVRKRLARIAEAFLFLVMFSYAILFLIAPDIDRGQAIEFAVVALIAQAITQTLIGVIEIVRMGR